jgi:hypothetical protein
MKHPLKNTKLSLILIYALLTACLVNAAIAQNTVVKAVASSSQPSIGETLTVDITISNVQNLFGVDATLQWDKNVLNVISATSLLGVESHPEGVLHETTTNPLMLVEDSLSQETGQYNIAATSTGSAPAFNGNGKIATLTFNVTGTGATGLSITSKLSDKPTTDQHSNLIEHTNTADEVESIPEFSSIAIIGLLVLAATVVLIASKKNTTKRQNLP